MNQIEKGERKGPGRNKLLRPGILHRGREPLGRASSDPLRQAARLLCKYGLPCCLTGRVVLVLGWPRRYCQPATPTERERVLRVGAAFPEFKGPKGPEIWRAVAAIFPQTARGEKKVTKTHVLPKGGRRGGRERGGLVSYRTLRYPRGGARNYISTALCRATSVQLTSLTHSLTHWAGHKSTKKRTRFCILTPTVYAHPD